MPHPGPRPPQGPAVYTPAGSKALRSQFCWRAQKGQGASREQRARPPGAPNASRLVGSRLHPRVPRPVRTRSARGEESELGGGQRAARRQALAGEGAPPTGKQRGRRTTATRGPHRFPLRTASQTRDKSPREGRCVASAPGDVHRTRGRPRPDASLPRADSGLEGSRAGPKKLKKTQQAGTPPSHAPHSHPTQPSSPRKQSW